MGRLPSQRWNEPLLQGLLGRCVAPGPVSVMFRALSFIAIANNCTCLTLGF